ncbi:hypothetical protein [Ktedonobacter robiniae]|uniref:Uncharacterized protein n=1 Tax=Ktedonobacter robiniae TaxID=2778365 RepID=A0ABQ3UHX8_9CHLR|nr:hypothetical protein [Ktedonobacter robiniae]GHO52190.1 hypothetical protein KSB_06650 [Ktedonobacter robiniae]
MHEKYTQRLLNRLAAAWPVSRLRPVHVEELDAKTWIVTYRDAQTGEMSRAGLSKAELRRQEQYVRGWSVLAGARSAPPPAQEVPVVELPGDASEPDALLAAEKIESMVRVLGAFVDTLVLNVYQTRADFEVIKGRLESDLVDELTLLKEQAQNDEEPVPSRFAFGGTPLLMTAKGGEGFQWILKNKLLTLAVNKGAKMRLVAQVRCSSEYLWSVRDLGKVVHEVFGFLVSIFGNRLKLQVSACDLAVDVVGLHLGTLSDVKRHFVSRAQLTEERPLSEDGMVDGPDGIKQRWGRLTGLPFGARNGRVSALLYNKKHEIQYKSKEKEWFYDLWRVARDAETGEPLWDGEEEVWRIEIRFKRPALNEMKGEDFHGIDDAFDLEDHLAGLWRYAVGCPAGGEDGLPDGWLRYIIPTDDTNRSRWPVHPDWQVIQGAFQEREELEETDYQREEREREELLQLVDEELAARPFSTDKKKGRRPGRRIISAARPVVPESFTLKPYIRERKHQVNTRQMAAQIGGCMETIEAWRPVGDDPDVVHDLSSTFSYVFCLVEDYFEEKGRDYGQRVSKKRVVYGTGDRSSDAA